jgi:glycosyltransferase involved in cell wall biosynthesis
MRVAFLLPEFSWRPSGGHRVVYEYANHLAARGHEVTVVHPRQLPKHPPAPASDLYGWITRKGVQLRNRARPAKIRWQPLDERVKIVIVPEPSACHLPDADAVFATAWQTAEYVAGYPESKGEKFYLIQHYEIWGGAKHQVDLTWRAPLHKVVISKWLYEKGRSLGCSESEMTCIPNGINCERFRLVTSLQERPKRIAMMCSNLEWKGSKDGLKAIEVAKDRHPALQAALFGICKRPAYVPRWIEYLRDPRQEVLIEQIYNGSSIYLCPSWTEGFGLPPAEAMACGCALASTNCTGISEYAEHEVTALLSPPRQPEVLAKSLLRLLENDDLRIRLALEGHRRIQTFTWEHSAGLLEEFIKARVHQGQDAGRPKSPLGTVDSRAAVGS